VARKLGLGVLGAVLAVVASANDGPGRQQDRLGTLFYSAAERSAISRERQGNTTAEVSNVLNVTGIVKREHGNSTVWINHQPVAEGQSLPPTSRTTISATGVTLDGQRLRVGEGLDLTTHERTDIVRPGTVKTEGKK
jgi:hypothetical protein